MPRQKDLKRHVRARMRKTGESYTAARAHLVAKKSRTTSARAGAQSPSSSEPRRDPAEIAGMSNESVRAKTGKSWAEWVEALDASGATALTHAKIARHILATYDDLNEWWAQMVTVGYERIRGLRDVGQRRGGAYEANKSRTFPVGISALYRAFAVARVRRKWLPVDLVIRTSQRERSMRITWDDGTKVDAYFVSKGPRKSTVAIQHRGLPTAAAREEAKTHWGERLDALRDLLE